MRVVDASDGSDKARPSPARVRTRVVLSDLDEIESGGSQFSPVDGVRAPGVVCGHPRYLLRKVNVSEGVIVRAHERQILAPNRDAARADGLAVLHRGAFDRPVVEHDAWNVGMLRPDGSQAKQDRAQAVLECLLRVRRAPAFVAGQDPLPGGLGAAEDHQLAVCVPTE